MTSVADIMRDIGRSSLVIVLAFYRCDTLWVILQTVWLVVFTFTVLLDVDLGLLVGLVYNLVPILLRTQR